ncbi:hypothetical protein ACHQM5_025656 [Ranunculus cassubicifolius]
MLLPEEILIEIFTFLPVISLFRFKCVSKSCLSLINSSIFVNLHLKRSIPRILYATYEDTYSIEYENTSSFSDPKPYDFPMNDQTIIGTCNGIVCITNRESYMSLWNPATQEDVCIPFSPVDESQEDEERQVVVGFGYDPIADEYKVVKSVFFYRDTDHKEFMQSQVKVSIVGSEEWRTIENPPCCLSNRHLVPQVNGCLHWLGVGSPIRIISFDVKDEVFRTVPLMTSVNGGDNGVEMTLGALRGCLSALVCQQGDTGMDVWLMKEYDVKESWAKQFSIKMPVPGMEFRSIEPLVLRKNGEIVLKCDGEMYLCDASVEHKFDVHCICDDPYSCYTAHMYVESLVSIADLIEKKGA